MAWVREIGTAKGTGAHNRDVANFEGLESTADGFVLEPSRSAKRSGWLVLLLPFGVGVFSVAIVVSTGRVLAIAMVVGFFAVITFVIWFTSVPPVFAMSGDKITLRGNVQRKTLSKSDLIGVSRGSLQLRTSLSKCYSLMSRDFRKKFVVEVRYFNPEALEEAMGRLGVQVTGDF
jgi:hypothetical protein